MRVGVGNRWQGIDIEQRDKKQNIIICILDEDADEDEDDDGKSLFCLQVNCN